MNPITAEARTDHGRAAGPWSISAVLPAYNEEAVIARTVRHVYDAVSRLSDDFEIIVTDDGSVDGTRQVLEQLRAMDGELRLVLIRHERNLGYGAALASGFDAAKKELIFFTDGDQQFDVREIELFLPEMDQQTDLVIGWRWRRADPPIRLLNAWGWKLLVNTLFGYTARDVDCAFKLFRRRVWTGVHVRSRGAMFSAELLIKARRLGMRVKELPVSHYPRTAGTPSGAHPLVIARAFKELFQLRVRLSRELPRRPLAATPALRLRS